MGKLVRVYCYGCKEEVFAEIREVFELMPVLGDSFPVKSKFYICSTCGKRIYNTRWDERMLYSLYAKFRQKYGLPSPQKIREYQEVNSLTLEQLAKEIGVSERSLSCYKGGALGPSWKVLGKIKKFFN